MTFQEALNITSSPAGTSDKEIVDEAIKTIKYFEDNVLELEDYETDQLYTALDKIYKLEELKMTNNTQKISDYKQEQEQKDYKTAYFEMDNRITELETNKQQLHDLLLAVETQLEEIEGVYTNIKKSFQSPNMNDYMDDNIRQLRSLLEVAQNHNDSTMNKQKND